MLRFAWDPEKAAINLRKHGVDFSEAATAFGDPHSLSQPDTKHSTDEERWLLLGYSAQGRLLVVAHTEGTGEIRIIHARVAEKAERKAYEEEP